MCLSWGSKLESLAPLEYDERNIFNGTGQLWQYFSVLGVVSGIQVAYIGAKTAAFQHYIAESLHLFNKWTSGHIARHCATNNDSQFIFQLS